MRRITGNSLSRSIILILTVIGVMGSFLLTSTIPMRTTGFVTKGRGILTKAVYYLFQEQAGDPASFKKAEDTSDSNLRAESQRAVSSLEGENRLGQTFYHRQIGTSSKNTLLSIKDSIQLILRI
jgi:hypothetical protein